MSLAIATSPSSPASSAASTSPIPPPTPLTPNSSANSYSLSADQFSNFDNVDANNTASVPAAPGQVGPTRRKPSRRANTAERRATHNAVERQRRETLNGRFLDLAALLPNLSSVRRPSKSAIVNSSIALIHTQRRVRSTAARELRLLRLEANQIRAELNEWRERAGMQRHEEPIRSREFEELLTMEESDEDLEQAERRAMDMAKESLRMEDMDGPFAFSEMGLYPGLHEDDEDTSSDGQGRHRPSSQGSSVGSIQALPVNVPAARQNITPSNPLIFDPTSALLQNHHTHQAGISPYSNFDLTNNTQQALALAGIPASGPQEKLAAWNASIYNNLAVSNQWNAPPQNYQALANQHNMFTPPASARSTNGFMPGFDDTRAAYINGQTTPPAPTPTAAFPDSLGAGDAFAAAYGASFGVGPNTWKNSGKVDAGITSGNGGGSGGLHYGAAMGLFM